MYASSTFIKVVVICYSGSKSELTIVIDAFVEYIHDLYFGFAKKVREPSVPSSILASLETSILESPTTVPSKIPAICSAVNFKFYCLSRLGWFTQK